MATIRTHRHRIPIAPCACGCGTMLRQVMHNGRVVQYLSGHDKVVNGEVLSKKVFTCALCGKEFSGVKNRDRRYCSIACYWKVRGYKFTGINWSYRKKRDDKEFHISRSKTTQRKQILKIKQACDQCDWNEYPEVLEVHHENHNQKDGRLENLKLLCPNCHEVHHLLTKTGKYAPGRFHHASEVRESLGAELVETHAI